MRDATRVCRIALLAAASVWCAGSALADSPELTADGELRFLLDWDPASIPLIPLEDMEQMCSSVLSKPASLAPELRNQILLRRAKVRVNLGEDELSEADIRDVLRDDPQSLDAQFALAAVLFSKKQSLVEALGITSDILRQAPDSWHGYDLMGSYYARTNRFKEAIASYGNAIERNTTSVQIRVNRAALYLHLGEYEKALADFNAAAALPPTPQSLDTPFHHFRGIVLARLGRFEEALSCFLFEYRANPDDLTVAIELFQCAAMLRKHGYCESLSGQILKMAPDEPLSHRLYALSLADNGDPDQALSYINIALQTAMALESEPEYIPFIEGERGTIKLLLGDYSAAKSAYETVLESIPGDPGTMLRYAFLLATCPKEDIRDGQKALQFAQTCEKQLKRPENRTLALVVLALAESECGRADDAIETLKAAIQIEATGGVPSSRITQLLAHLETGAQYRFDSTQVQKPLFHIPCTLPLLETSINPPRIPSPQ